MAFVELFVQENYKLCDDAKLLLARLQKEFPFELKFTPLTETHPKFAEYAIAIPVARVDDIREFKSAINETELREYMRDRYPFTTGFYVGKTMEAFGFLIVAVGLMFGFRGDMWSDLFYLLSGIVIFYAGRVLERRSVQRRLKLPPRTP